VIPKMKWQWHSLSEFFPLSGSLILISDVENIDLVQCYAGLNKQRLKQMFFISITLTECETCKKYPDDIVKHPLFWLPVPILTLPKIYRSVPAHIRLKILKRDRYTCQLCNSSPSKNNNIELEIDHINPYSICPSHDINNLQTLCKNVTETKEINMVELTNEYVDMEFSISAALLSQLEKLAEDNEMTIDDLIIMILGTHIDVKEIEEDKMNN
jgi:hypothetical protein